MYFISITSIFLNQMKEGRDGTKTERFNKSPSADSYPRVLDVDDFKVTTFRSLICNYVQHHSTS